MRKSLISFAAAATVVAGLAAAPMAGAADDYFLKINGVSGDQTLGKVTDAISVDSFSLGVENSTTIGSMSAGAGAGKAQFDKLTITKSVDGTSPVLYSMLAKGQPIQGMELVARKAGATPGSSYIYQRYFFEPAFLTSDQQSADGGDDGIKETLEFSVGAMQMTNVKQALNGTQTPIVQTWNQILNSASLVTPNMPAPPQNGQYF
jgi:type VI secretion system secreted protein Hcp